MGFRANRCPLGLGPTTPIGPSHKIEGVGEARVVSIPGSPLKGAPWDNQKEAATNPTALCPFLRFFPQGKPFPNPKLITHKFWWQSGIWSPSDPYWNWHRSIFWQSRTTASCAKSHTGVTASNFTCHKMYVCFKGPCDKLCDKFCSCPWTQMNLTSGYWCRQGSSVREQVNLFCGHGPAWTPFSSPRKEWNQN